MDFIKMQGLGNDFVVIDLLSGGGARDWAELAVWACDRRFGIGADGLVILQQADKADARMRIFNPDGSEAQMCGNALRCVSIYLSSRGRVQGSQIEIDTKAGLRIGTLKEDNLVQVDMGEPIWESKLIPVNTHLTRFITEEIPGYGFQATCVSMGNPHCVIFVPQVDQIQLEQIGPQIERHPLFPQGINVEFVQVHNPQKIQVRVWERGAGMTLACGTGACASLAVGAKLNLCHREAVVALPGGDLAIAWREDNHIYMTGTAQEVFSGRF